MISPDTWQMLSILSTIVFLMASGLFVRSFLLIFTQLTQAIVYATMKSDGVLRLNGDVWLCTISFMVMMGYIFIL